MIYLSDLFAMTTDKVSRWTARPSMVEWLLRTAIAAIPFMWFLCAFQTIAWAGIIEDDLRGVGYRGRRKASYPKTGRFSGR